MHRPRWTDKTLALACLLAGLAVTTEAARALTLDQGSQGSRDIHNDASDPSPPVWADAYKVEFVVSMPHFYLTQPQGLSIPVTAWYDSALQRSKIASFGGMDTVMFITEGDEKREYELHPRIDKLTCWVDEEQVIPGPARKLKGLLGDDSLILPDLSEYVFAGNLMIDGAPAHAWSMQFKEGESVNTYNFYSRAKDGYPLKFHMFGYNVIAVGHYDEYIYEFKTYTPGTDDKAFQVPPLCKPGSALRRPEGQRGWLGRQLALLMPGARSPRTLDASLDLAYAHYSLQAGRAPALHHAQLQQRLQRFKQVHARVAAHNADPTRTYTMQLGRFADWTEEEVYGTMMPDAWRRKQGLPAKLRASSTLSVEDVEPGAFDSIGDFKPKLHPKDLPKQVDWRGTGADPGVKDQGMCGSCWTFGATAAMEGSWYVQTGEKRSFSEQQILDCSYNFGMSGCDGGDAKPAINYVARYGGIALEQDYYYHSTGDFCKATNYTRIGMFDGFLQVEPRNEAALMEAVYTMGPLAVGIDPSPDSFLYYKEGVWTDKECDIKFLDHQVILFGYGTTPEGQDYWLVKNMWSKFWGEDGYIKIVRGKGDCGIATDGNVAVVSKASLRPGAGSRSLESVRSWRRLGAAEGLV